MLFKLFWPWSTVRSTFFVETHCIFPYVLNTKVPLIHISTYCRAMYCKDFSPAFNLFIFFITIYSWTTILLSYVVWETLTYRDLTMSAECVFMLKRSKKPWVCLQSPGHGHMGKESFSYAAEGLEICVSILSRSQLGFCYVTVTVQRSRCFPQRCWRAASGLGTVHRGL